VGAEPDAVADAARELERSGQRFVAARNASLAAEASVGSLVEANRLLRRVEPLLTRPTGLVGRPQLRNLIFAADRDNGYANVQFPGVVEALRDRDAARAGTEARDLATRIRAAAAQVDAARGALPGPR